MNEQKHWSEDPYWTDALETFSEFQENGKKKQFVVNITELLDVVYKEEGPAYRLMEAMVSVKEQEGMDGFRGAPRLLLALLVRLEELSRSKPA